MSYLPSWSDFMASPICWNPDKDLLGNGRRVLRKYRVFSNSLHSCKGRQRSPQGWGPSARLVSDLWGQSSKPLRFAPPPPPIYLGHIVSGPGLGLSPQGSFICSPAMEVGQGGSGAGLQHSADLSVVIWALNICLSGKMASVQMS